MLTHRFGDILFRQQNAVHDEAMIFLLEFWFHTFTNEVLIISTTARSVQSL